MGKKKVKSKRKSELRIIFFIILVAAVLFVISTYAWFSTQRNVSITNLSGLVEVAEGLEISLDAENWSNEIVLGENMNIIDNAYENHRNISPKELLPVSTLGKVNTAGTDKDVKMIRGKITNSKELSNIVYMDESLALAHDSETHNSDLAKYPGYFAFDIFLKNSSKQYKDDDALQLNYDSSLQIIEDGNDTVGLQNTVRLALAKYGTGALVSGDVTTGKDIVRTGVADVMAGQEEVLKKTGAVTGGDNVGITDVTMWEPNSSDHVDYIVTNNNMITWSASEGPKYGTYSEDRKIYLFNTSTQMPTYALTDATVGEGNVIKDIYWWDLDNTYKVKGDETSYSNKGKLEKQNVLQTTNTKKADGTIDYTIDEGVQNLFSTFRKDTEKPTEPAAFKIAPNSIIRLRVYVWLEGQDVDCINYASHGGGITLNLGLIKGANEGDDETTVTE